MYLETFGDTSIYAELTEKDLKEMERGNSSSEKLHFNNEALDVEVAVPPKALASFEIRKKDDGEVYDDIREALFEMLAAFADLQERVEYGDDPEKVFEEVKDAYEIEKADRTYDFYHPDNYEDF